MMSVVLRQKVDGSRYGDACCRLFTSLQMENKQTGEQTHRQTINQINNLEICLICRRLAVNRTGVRASNGSMESLSKQPRSVRPHEYTATRSFSLLLLCSHTPAQESAELSLLVSDVGRGTPGGGKERGGIFITEWRQARVCKVGGFF